MRLAASTRRIVIPFPEVSFHSTRGISLVNMDYTMAIGQRENNNDNQINNSDNINNHNIGNNSLNWMRSAGDRNGNSTLFTCALNHTASSKNYLT